MVGGVGKMVLVLASGNVGVVEVVVVVVSEELDDLEERDW